MKFVGQETMDGAPVLHFRGRADSREARELFASMADLFEKTSLDSPLARRLANSVRGGTTRYGSAPRTTWSGA